jgi:hypothetical protein
MEALGGMSMDAARELGGTVAVVFGGDGSTGSQVAMAGNTITITTAASWM